MPFSIRQPNSLRIQEDDLNLSASANDLLLYPSHTVTRGGGSETLQVGTGSDPLNYHAVETIGATTSGSEQFIFGAGFGNETINGATPDLIQLAKSAPPIPPRSYWRKFKGGRPETSRPSIRHPGQGLGSFDHRVIVAAVSQSGVD